MPLYRNRAISTDRRDHASMADALRERFECFASWVGGVRPIHQSLAKSVWGKGVQVGSVGGIFDYLANCVGVSIDFAMEAGYL